MLARVPIISAYTTRNLLIHDGFLVTDLSSSSRKPSWMSEMRTSQTTMAPLGQTVMDTVTNRPAVHHPDRHGWFMPTCPACNPHPKAASFLRKNGRTAAGVVSLEHCKVFFYRKLSCFLIKKWEAAREDWTSDLPLICLSRYRWAMSKFVWNVFLSSYIQPAEIFR